MQRYVVESKWGNHSEGQPRPGETDGAHDPAAFEAIASAHGFDLTRWLADGQVWRIRWTMLDPDTQPDKHKTLYFGPLRMRVDHIEEAARADLMSDDEV